MAIKVTPIPPGYHTLTPMLTVRDVDKAIDFYKRALGADERMRLPGPDGKSIMHAELKIGDSIIMLGEEQPAMGCRGPQNLGGTPVGLYLYVEDADQAFNRAVSAGATVLMPVADMFWGDRCGQFTDPFGHKWSLATHKEDLSQEEIRQRATAFFAQMAKKPA
ncbi:MAG: VOC family protein [Nitrospirae bacterium]|nr:VOC family protein [Nitrospirota bacterium]